MSTRKTIEVETIKTMVNDMLEKSIPELVEGRESVAILLSNILMETGNYHGYNLLAPWNKALVDYDDSRRRYF